MIRASLIFASVLLTVSAHAGDYYDTFKFQVLGSCQDINTVWFRSATNYSAAILSRDAQDKREEAEIDHLQLFADETYWVTYRENTTTPSATGGGRFVTETFSKVFEGKWSVQGERLELAGFGFGVPGRITSSAGEQLSSIVFQLNQRVNDGRVVGVKFDLARITTNVGPKGKSINQYCGISR